ncbi:MAG: FAD-dependent monooxygenase [Burkholderiales bacterium]
MRISVLGAGPAGLLFALLAKRRRTAWSIEVVEQNPPDATFGFGVVFSRGALEFLARDAPDLHAALAARMESWPMQRIVHRGQAVDVDGNGFSAIARMDLLGFLQQRCRDAGVALHFGERLEAPPDADLVVGADGLNSVVRETGGFAPELRWLGNRFVWYGTRQPFECLTLTFRESTEGAFVAHHYRYAPDMSTFIVECDEATWRRAGLDRLDDAASRAYCERVFAADLGGCALVSNKSAWRQFPLLSNRRWHAGNRVLIGDALRSMHFSIGSGTRLAFEDAIALDRAFAETGDDVPAALAAFERERRPVVEKLFAAAGASSEWYEDFPARMGRHDALGLAHDYMTRSGRMSDERLRSIAPAFMARVEKVLDRQ